MNRAPSHAVPAPQPLSLLAPTITATKVDALFSDVDGDLVADPGDTIEYTVNISNSGTDASNVIFSDPIDEHTTLVGGSVNSSPIAFDDAAYTATGNVNISVPVGSGLLANDIDPDSGTNAGLLATVETKKSSQCGACATNNVSISANGSFTYNPPPGFTGTDTFVYTITDASGATNTATATFTVSGMIWFINSSAGGGGDGRLTAPFNCLVGAGCFDTAAADDPGDNIFLHSGSYTGGLTLLANQRLIGQGAGASLSTITGITPPAGSGVLPSTGGTRPTITTVAAATNAVTVGSGNTLRGVNIGNTTAADITGSGFGTLTVSEVELNGTGRLLNLTNGTLAATFDNFQSTSSSGGPGLSLTTTGGSLTVSGTTSIAGASAQGISISGSAGAASFGTSTTIGATTQGILVGTSTGNISFGNTSITAGTDGVSLQNNSGGTRSFGTLSTTNGGGAGFLHGVGGGTTTITGATTITNPGAQGINIQDSTSVITFANVTIAGSGGTGVFLDDNTGAVIFADLDITPDANQRGLHATDQATGALTTASGTLGTTNATAVEIIGTSAANRTPLNVQLTSVSALASGGNPPNGIVLGNTSATGAPGGFRVLGSGGSCNQTTPTCTGGRLQSTTGADAGATPAANAAYPGVGVRLIDATTVVLTRMRIDNHSNFAVRGTSISGFTLDTCLIDGTNGTSITADDDGVGTSGEGAVRFTNLSGSAAITNSQIGGAHESIVRVNNNTGTLDRLTISGSTIGDLDGAGAGFGNSIAGGDDGLQIEAKASAVVNVSLLGSTLNQGKGDVVQVAAQQNSIVDCVMRGNSISNSHSSIVSGVGGVTIGATSGPGQTANLTYDISCNKFQDAKGNALTLFKGVGGTSNMSGTVFNNRIGVTGVVGSASDDAAGIQVDAQGAGTHTVLIKDNQIRRHNFAGISMQSGDGSATMNATVVGNLVAEPGALGFAGFYAESGAIPASDTIKFNLKIGGAGAEQNNFVDGDPANINDVLYSKIGAGTQFNLSRGVSGSNDPAIITKNNNVSPLTVGGPATITPVNTVPVLPAAIDESCSPPSLMALPANEVALISPRRHASEKPLIGSSKPTTTPAAMTIVQASTASLTGRAVGKTAANESRETKRTRRFGKSKTFSHHATIKTAKRSAVNLPINSPHSTMVADTVVVAGSGTGFTLPGGKSITIKFRVTVNNPPNLTLLNPARVRNQGSVTYTGGPVGGVLTDDPSVGGASDPTETPVDLFNVTTAFTSNNNPSDFGELVTFTATVTSNPAGNPNTITGTIQFFDNGTPLACNEGGVNGIRPVSGGSAACTTSTLSATTNPPPPHIITAQYSGDGNFEPGTAATLAGGQTVNPCTVNPIVTSTANSGANTLRDALVTACSPPNNNITFNLGAGSNTIAVTTELLISKNVNITNVVSGTNGPLTISGGGTSRVFKVNGFAATMVNLTIANGNGIHGGAIHNDHGDLTVQNITFTNNTAPNATGGAIYNNGQTIGSASLKVINSTFSLNTAPNGKGGAIINYGDGGTATLDVVNSTFSGNSAANGGAILNEAGATGIATLKVFSSTFNGNIATTAGGGIYNFGPDNDTRLEIVNTILNGSTGANIANTSGMVVSQGHNLSSDAAGGDGATGPGGLLNGIGDQRNTNPRLGALASNGGPTQTFALLTGSPALDAGDNAFVTAPPFLNTSPITDQRGTGFKRILDSAPDADATDTVDIGAYEAHPSIQEIPDQVGTEDVDIACVSFEIGDVDEPLAATPFTFSSTNTTLVPNVNISLGPGGATTRCLIIDLASNQSGTTDITVTIHGANGQSMSDTFTLTVNSSNDAPTVVGAGIPDVSINEDAADTTISLQSYFADDEDGSAGLGYTIQNNSNPGLFTSVTLGAGNVLTLDYAPNASGTANITIRATDTSALFVEDTFTVTVNGVNDQPALAALGNLTIAEDATSQTVNLSGINAGSGESQTLAVTAVSSDTAIVPNPSVTYISPNATGSISFAPAADANGEPVTITVTVTDDGGTLNGGVNSVQRQFTVTVTEVNDAPVAADDTPADVQEDSGPNNIAISTLVGNDNKGATNESGETLNIIAVSNAVGGTVQIVSTNVVFAPTTNYNGPASFDYTVEDNGTTGGSADAKTDTGTATFNVTAVNDPPSFVKGGDQTISIDAGGQTVAGWATAISQGPGESGQTPLSFNVVAQGGATVTFSSAPAIDASTGNLSYTANAGSSGTATFNVSLSDSGASAPPPNNNTSAVQTFTITVVPTLGLIVNDNGDAADNNVGDRICDANAAVGDQCTLRAAIQETNAAATPDTIGFLPSNTTITLTGALPDINGDLVITGPASGVTVNGNNLNRVFKVLAGRTVSILNLTMANGRASQGGGIFNSGTLTVSHSTLTGNNAVAGTAEGGAIYADSGTLTILNSTISGNNANGAGGGLNNAGTSTATLVNVTVMNNRTDADGAAPGPGGGMAQTSSNALTLHNTIVAGNYTGVAPGTAPDDINGTVDPASNNNLIGTGGSGGLTNGGNNNQVGVVDARLGVLASNGGPTRTHALLSGSVALDAGDDSITGVPYSLTTDQRGLGFPRQADGPDADTTPTVDIGAFEADPSVEDISDKSTSEDTALPPFIFNVGDSSTAFTSITATSSKTTLVPNANIVVGPDTASTRTLSITPAANEFGTTTITVTVTKGTQSMSDTFILAVNGVNDPPSFGKGPDQIVVEDAGPQSVANWATSISQGPGNESGQTLTFVVQTNSNPSLFSAGPAISSTGTLTYAPADSANGTATITIALMDDGSGSDTSGSQQFVITITEVNDAPDAIDDSLTSVAEDSGMRTISIASLKANDNAGPANESGQTLTFSLVVASEVGGTVSSDATNVYFTPTANYNGPANFQYMITDNGTTNIVADPKNDTATVSFTITAVNDPPSFTKGGDQAVAEDSGAQSVSGWATNISQGPNESGQTLTFVVQTNTNPGLFSGGPAISPTGTLTYTPAANANGSATITITLMDNGGGSDTSGPQSFVITVTEVNDAPDAVDDALTSVAEDSGQRTIAIASLSANDSKGPANESGQTLTLTGVSNPVGGTVSSDATNVYFTPTAGYSGPASFQYQVTDNGTTNGVADPKNDTATVSFTITGVNDAPIAVNDTLPDIPENSGPRLIQASTLAANDAKGGTNENGQTLIIKTVINVEGGTVAIVDGNVVFTPTPNYHGPAIFTYSVEDNGTTNGSPDPKTSNQAVVQFNIYAIGSGGVLRFSAANYSVEEGEGFRTITVERTGDTSRPVTVDYASSDHSNPADFIPCTSPGAGQASSRCDFTTAIGTLRFAAGETSKTFNVLINQDNYVEGPETLELTLSNPTNGAVFGVPQTAILSITDDASEPATNPIDNSADFVRAQYHDILGREPDAGGLAFWTDNIEKCNDPARIPPGQTVPQCIDKQRETTAIAFFMSPEFQMTGGFVYHLYKGSLTGTLNYDGGSPGRFPTFLEFMHDMSQVSEGIVVNGQISGAVVEANRNALAAAFVARPEFVAKYGGLNNTLYVQELFNTTGIAATAAEKQALVDALTGGDSRASVLRKVVDGTVVISESNVQFTTTYGQAFINQQNNRLFVYLEYIGYLRRNPDTAGYVFWLGKLNFYNGDPFQAEMVRAFILSPEYRNRFGQP